MNLARKFSLSVNFHISHKKTLPKARQKDVLTGAVLLKIPAPTIAENFITKVTITPGSDLHVQKELQRVKFPQMKRL